MTLTVEIKVSSDDEMGKTLFRNMLLEKIESICDVQITDFTERCGDKNEEITNFVVTGFADAMLDARK